MIIVFTCLALMIVCQIQLGMPNFIKPSRSLVRFEGGNKKLPNPGLFLYWVESYPHPSTIFNFKSLQLFLLCVSNRIIAPNLIILRGTYFSTLLVSSWIEIKDHSILPLFSLLSFQ
jgi:hypothetical protein